MRTHCDRSLLRRVARVYHKGGIIEAHVQEEVVHVELSDALDRNVSERLRDRGRGQ